MGLKRIDISGTTPYYTYGGAHGAVMQYVTDTIIPALESIPGISYVGSYYTEDKPNEIKYMFEFGYANYYFAVSLNGVNVRFAISKKIDSQNLEYFVLSGYGITSIEKTTIIDGTTNYQRVYTGVIDYMLNDLNNALMILYDPGSTSGMTYTFDEDNYGNKFMFYGDAEMKVTYDNDLYLKDGLPYATITNNIADSVYIENVALVQASKLMGVSKHLRRIQSSALSAAESIQTLIDVEGTRYRQLKGIYWVIER